jgi:hypothetical protein
MVQLVKYSPFCMEPKDVLVCSLELAMETILTKEDPVHNVTVSFIKIHFMSSSYRRLGLSDVFSSSFPTKIYFNGPYELRASSILSPLIWSS